MQNLSSSSALIFGLGQGDEHAARQFVDEFFLPMSQIAKAKLRESSCRSVDEEDIVQIVFSRFLIRARQNMFPELANRKEIFRLLRKMTSDLAIDIIRTHNSLRRGSGLVRGDSVFSGSSRNCQFASKTLTARDAETLQSEFDALLDLLGDDPLRQIALAKFHGLSNANIAKRMHCSLRTVERRISLIRKIWRRTL